MGIAPGGIPLGMEVKVGSDALRPDQEQFCKNWVERGGKFIEVRPDRDGWQAALADGLAFEGPGEAVEFGKTGRARAPVRVWYRPC